MSNFSFLFHFFVEIHESKQNSPESVAILFAYVPLKGCQAYMG